VLILSGMNYNVIVVSVNNSYSNSVCVYISVNYRKVGLLAKILERCKILKSVVEFNDHVIENYIICIMGDCFKNFLPKTVIVV